MKTLYLALLSAVLFWADGKAHDVKTDTAKLADLAAEKLIDDKLAAKADVVLRVKRLTSSEGDKYLWYRVQVLKVLKNQSNEIFTNTLSVAGYSWKDGVPDGESTIYLERYNQTDGKLWKLVGGEALIMTADPINQLVTRLSATHGLWRNGRWMPIDLPETAPSEQVLNQMFQMYGFNNSHMTSCKILTIRQVHIDDVLYTAAFVQTDLGNKIALFTAGGRWNRVYDK